MSTCQACISDRREKHNYGTFVEQRTRMSCGNIFNLSPLHKSTQHRAEALVAHFPFALETTTPSPYGFKAARLPVGLPDLSLPFAGGDGGMHPPPVKLDQTIPCISKPDMDVDMVSCFSRA